MRVFLQCLICEAEICEAEFQPDCAFSLAETERCECIGSREQMFSYVKIFALREGGGGGAVALRGLSDLTRP